MVSVSKSNTNIINSANSQTYLMEQYHHSHSQDLNMFKNESLLLLGQLKDIMLREGD